MTKERVSKENLFLEHVKTQTDYEEYCDDIFVNSNKVFYHLKKPKPLLSTYKENVFLLSLKNLTTMFGLQGPFEYFNTFLEKLEF